MPDKYFTQPVSLAGGLIRNLDGSTQAVNLPGSAIVLENYEASLLGGYSRIRGVSAVNPGTVQSQQWDAIGEENIAIPSAEGAYIKGVHIFEGTLYAARGSYIYRAEVSDSAWTNAVPALPHTNTTDYCEFEEHSFTGVKTLIVCDGAGRPWKFTVGGSWALINGTGSENWQYVKEFSNHVFYAGGTNIGEVIFSAPNTDNDFNPGNGAGSFSVGRPVLGMGKWRDQLFIFCKDAIYRITGTSLSNFALAQVTGNMGLQYKGALAELAGDVYFLSSDGIRNIAGTDRVGDFNLATVTLPVYEQVNRILDEDTRYCLGTLPGKSQLRLMSFSPTKLPAAQGGVIGTLKRDTWEWSTTKGIQATCTATGYIGGALTTIIGNSTGQVFFLDSGNTFNGTEISFRFQSPYLPLTEDFSQRKNIHSVMFDAVFDGTSTLFLLLNFDNESREMVQPSSILIEKVDASSARYNDGSTWNSGKKYSTRITAGFDTFTVGSGTVVSVILSGTGGSVHRLKDMFVRFVIGGKR